MEAEPTDAREMLDYKLSEALESHAEDELDGLSIQNRRLGRIQEYEDVCLARPDPYAAIIGMGTSSLQRVFEHLGNALLDELDSHTHKLEEVREYTPEIRLLVKLRNAIEADLEFQSADTEPPATAFPHNRKSTGQDTKVPTSQRDLLPKRWTPKY